MSKFRWNDEKDEALKKLYAEYAELTACELNRTIAQILGCSSDSVEHRRAKLKLWVKNSFAFRPQRN